MLSDDNARRAAGVQRRVRRCFGPNDKRRSERGDIGLDVENVDTALAAVPLHGISRAKGETADAQGLRKALAVAQKTSSRLENPNAFRFAVDIGAQSLDETAEKVAAHDVQIARNRVEHLDRMRSDLKLALPLRIDEAECDDFLIIATDQTFPEHRKRAQGFPLGKHPLRM